MWPQVALRVTMAQPFCWHLPSDTELSNPGAPILGLPGSLASEAPTAVVPGVGKTGAPCVPKLILPDFLELSVLRVSELPSSR